MPSGPTTGQQIHHGKLKTWLERQKSSDPEFYNIAKARLSTARKPVPQLEAAAPGLMALGLQKPSLQVPIALETIVRTGRPALFVEGNKVTREGSNIDDLGEVSVQRLEAAQAKIDPMIPLVGRIDVKNYPTGQNFLGTGWLIDDDLVITNRHVAELIAQAGADRYEFIVGLLGERVSVSLGFGHEQGGPAGPSVDIAEVLYIEPEGPGPDIALLKVNRQSDGTKPKFIPLSNKEPEPDQDVVAIGYPARASSDLIPDQDWMERIYGRIYDVKRAAPGKITDPSRGWSTHDCTTLGGNSGSVLLDLATGEALALHFAGLYLVENYAVPASTLREYRGKRPWPYKVETNAPASRSATPAPTEPHSRMNLQTGASGNAVTVTLPLTITISLGQPSTAAGATALTSEPEASASALGAQLRLGGGVVVVRPGVPVENGAMRDGICLVVAADPGQVESVRARTPSNFAGFEVQVRPASIADQLGGDIVTEAPRVIAYDDQARTGPDFRLDWVTENMTLRLHVGPDRGFEELSAFLKPTTKELVSSIYQFYADHICGAVDAALGPKVTMTLVADPQTRDKGPTPSAGEFERAPTFEKWRTTRAFENIYVPEGNGGLVDNAYHIKVTVRDGQHVWLSSGNWTKTSQPLIAQADRMNSSKVSRSGNREWHVVAESKSLATRFRSHILEDLKQCKDLGGRLEAVSSPDIMVDVPETLFEAIDLEAAADQLFEPLTLTGKRRVLPLLTPDHQGGVYCDAVLALINSARQQLLFQNQYINVTKSSAGRFGALVDALARAAQRLPDCRIILRSDGPGFWDNIAELKRRGIDVTTQVKRLANTHTKGIIVDGKQVLVGSHNWSQSGVTANRDASLIIDNLEAAAYFANVFEVDWKRASKLTQPQAAPSNEAARLATGSAPPPGFRRVPLADLVEG